MKKASLLKQEIANNQYDQQFTEIYLDTARADAQKARYMQAIDTFISLYGDKEVAIFSTPGRSEVCGNHTDHQHGEVLATAINLDIIAVVAKHDHHIKIQSDDYDIQAIELTDLAPKEAEKETSEALIRGTLARFQELGLAIGGFEAYMTSDVLQGSGLSSSAAFEVMIGTVLSGLYHEKPLDPVTIAKIGQYSENVYFGKPCGLMDQCACSVGGLIHIDFKNTQAPVVEKVHVDFSEFKHSLCIVDVHASHADLTDDYASIPAEMKQVASFFNEEVLREVDEDDFLSQLSDVREATSDRAVLRALHLFNENKRVRQACAALENQDFRAFKNTIRASGDSSFKYLQNVYSNQNINQQAVSLALALSEVILGDHGVCRVHGGGFAGTIQAFVEDDYVKIYQQEIEHYFGKGSCHILKIRQYGGIKVMD